MSGLDARRYSNIKYASSIVDFGYLLFLLSAFLVSGISANLSRAVGAVTENSHLAAGLYFLFVSCAYYILDFPLNFYRSFILEHQFGLTRQSLKAWFFDQLKGGSIAFIIGFLLLEVFYFLLKWQPWDWWWMISLFWVFLSLVLAKLAPVFIIPLFFKYKKYSDESLRQRIIGLSRKMKVSILDVFEIDLSSKTEKANAALVGFGNTRRVVLGDTLKDKYSVDEIEVILAHELAHQKLNHLLKLVLCGALSTLLVSWIVFTTSPAALRIFRLQGLSDLAALPLVFLYLAGSTMILGPWESFLSRRFETQADRLALQVTGKKEAFISTMEKLSSQNLADRSPHPLIKFFFFDHPPIDERIALARAL